MPGERIAGRFEVLTAVGVGPLGVTYRVLDRHNRVELSLKILAESLVATPEDRAAFVSQMEVFVGRTIGGCAMPLEVGTEGETVYVTAPWIEGVSLRAAMEARAARRRPFTQEEALRVILALAAATSALHSTTSHGALRPENVVLTPRGLVLTHGAFAVALRIETLAARMQGFAHAVPFIAPEVSAGRKITATADLFALGAIATELLTGSPSVQALDGAGLPAEIDTALRALLDRDRSRRPGAVGALLDALARSCGYSRRPPDAPLPVPVPSPVGSVRSRSEPPRVARASSPPLGSVGVSAPMVSGSAPASAESGAAEMGGQRSGPSALLHVPRMGLPPAAVRKEGLAVSGPSIQVPPLPRVPSSPPLRLPSVPSLSTASPVSVPPLPGRGAEAGQVPVAAGYARQGRSETKQNEARLGSRREERNLEGIDPRLLRAARRLEAERQEEGEEIDAGEIEVIEE